MGCNNLMTEEYDKLIEKAMRGETCFLDPEIERELMPEVREKLRVLDEEEAKSKEDLERQSNEAKHIHIEANPEDYPKAVPAIPVRGFDVSEKITDQEIRDKIRDDPMMRVHEMFFPGKMTSEDYTGGPKFQYRIIDGKPHTGPILGETIPDPITGEKHVEINEHRERDLPKTGFVDKKAEIEKMSIEERNQLIKRVMIGTHFHETRAHVFGEDMLSEEAKAKLDDLFKDTKTRGKEAFVTPYAKKDKWEYLGEGAAWYSDHEKQQELVEKDPKLHGFIKEIEEECKSFLAISKNLILVRGGKK